MALLCPNLTTRAGTCAVPGPRRESIVARLRSWHEPCPEIECPSTGEADLVTALLVVDVRC